MRRARLPVPARALAIGAHPDDIEFGAGATLARWSDAGCEVSLLVCTDGAKGTWEAGADPAELVAVRQREQRAAAAELGATGEVEFLDRVDGELEAGLAERREVVSWIRRLRPEVVLGHDPWKRYRLHPDHRAAGFLACDALVAARDPHFFADQRLLHHRPGALLLFEADDPDHVEDATGFGARKVAALEAHRSQELSTMGIAPDDDGTQRARFHQKVLDELATNGRAVGAAEGEAFRLLDDL